jgi:hypothetical protein
VAPDVGVVVPHHLVTADLAALADQALPAVQSVLADAPATAAAASIHAQAVLAPFGQEAQARVQQNIQLLEGLVGWISLQLPALQAVSPEAALSISSGLDALTTSLHSALAADLSSQTQQMASGLVLGMQQLVATLKLQEGASSITAMAAAQEAMAGTFTVRHMGGSCLSGVGGWV